MENKIIGDSLSDDKIHSVVPVDPVMSDAEKEALDKLREAAQSAGGIK